MSFLRTLTVAKGCFKKISKGDEHRSKAWEGWAFQDVEGRAGSDGGGGRELSEGGWLSSGSEYHVVTSGERKWM